MIFFILGAAGLGILFMSLNKAVSAVKQAGTGPQGGVAPLNGRELLAIDRLRVAKDLPAEPIATGPSGTLPSGRAASECPNIALPPAVMDRGFSGMAPEFREVYYEPMGVDVGTISNMTRDFFVENTRNLAFQAECRGYYDVATALYNKANAAASS